MAQKSAVAGNPTPAMPMTAEQRATFDRVGGRTTKPSRARHAQIKMICSGSLPDH
jgi:hypothetical protein